MPPVNDGGSAVADAPQSDAVNDQVVDSGVDSGSDVGGQSNDAGSDAGGSQARDDGGRFTKPKRSGGEFDVIDPSFEDEYEAPDPDADDEQAGETIGDDADDTDDAAPAATKGATAKQAGAQLAKTNKSTDAGAADAGIDARLIAEAESYGLTKEEIATFGSDAELDRALAILDRAASRRIAAGNGGQQGQGQGQAAPTSQQGNQTQSASSGAAQRSAPADVQTQRQPAQQQADQGQTGANANRPFEKLKIELDPNDWDEQTIGLVNKLNDHYDTAVTQLHSQLEQRISQFEQYVNRQNTDRFIGEVDSFVASLGPDFEDTFGKGSLNELDPGSNESKQRVELMHEMQRLRQADQLAGRQPASNRRYAERAVRSLDATFNKLINAERSKTVKRVEQRRGMAVSRPTSVQTKAMTGEERARQREREFYRSRGIEHDHEPDPDV